MTPEQFKKANELFRIINLLEDWRTSLNDARKKLDWANIDGVDNVYTLSNCIAGVVNHLYRVSNNSFHAIVGVVAAELDDVIKEKFEVLNSELETMLPKK